MVVLEELQLVVGVLVGLDVDGAEDDGVELVLALLEDVGLLVEAGLGVDVAAALQLQLHALREVAHEHF